MTLVQIIQAEQINKNEITSLRAKIEDIDAQMKALQSKIGVAIGIGVTLIFWPDKPKETLSKNLIQVLRNSERLLQTMVGNDRANPSASAAETTLIGEIASAIKNSKSVLGQEMYGIIGSNLAQENWSSILASTERIHRHLAQMIQLLQPEPSRLNHSFAEPLAVRTDRVSYTCTALTEIIRSPDSAKDNPFRLPFLHRSGNLWLTPKFIS